MKSIAERDGEIATCPTCGWHEHGQLRPDECDPGAGKAADKLVGLLPGTPSTRVGYGLRQLAFEPVANDARFCVRFKVRNGGRGAKPFELEDVWLLADLSSEAAADLVTVLAAWRKRWGS